MRAPTRHAMTRLAGALLLCAVVVVPTTRPTRPTLPTSTPSAPPARAAHAGDEIRRGKWTASQVPDGWVVESTRHYQVQSQIGRDAARDLGRHLEDMLALYRAFLPTTRSLDEFVVKVFADRDAHIAYCRTHGIDGSGSYFDREARELLAWDTGIVLGKREIPTAIHLDPDRALTLPHADMQRVLLLLDQATAAYTPDTGALLAHEGWHQYFHEWMTSWVPTPAWVEEGVGDWFATARPDEAGRYRAGSLNHGRLRDLHRALEEGTTVHTESLLRLSTTEYYERDEVYYAQGWSLVQFLLQHRDATWRALIPRLLKDFRDSKDWRGSTQTVLEGIDMDRLHEEWLDWVLDQKPIDPLRDLAREYGDRIAPDQLVADDAIVRLYGWHLRHPDAPSRATSRLR